MLAAKEPSEAVVAVVNVWVWGSNMMISRDGSFPDESNQISVKYPLPIDEGDTLAVT
jgi:hypothetical protein